MWIVDTTCNYNDKKWPLQKMISWNWVTIGSRLVRRGATNKECWWTQKWSAASTVWLEHNYSVFNHAQFIHILTCHMCVLHTSFRWLLWSPSNKVPYKTPYSKRTYRLDPLCLLNLRIETNCIQSRQFYIGVNRKCPENFLPIFLPDAATQAKPGVPLWPPTQGEGYSIFLFQNLSSPLE